MRSRERISFALICPNRFAIRRDLGFSTASVPVFFGVGFLAVPLAARRVFFAASALARLARAAFGHDTILNPMTQITHELKRTNSEDTYTVKNTNRLIKEPDTFVIAGKTGYTEEAGYCFLGLAENEKGDQIIITVLGMDTDWGRFEEAEKIAEWVFTNYKWNKN